MQKKKAKKSWRRHQRIYCWCYLCMGDGSRHTYKTRTRKKYRKYPKKIFEE